MRQFHTGSHHTPAFCNVSAETVFVIAFNYLIVLNFIINRYYCQAVFAAAANASVCILSRAVYARVSFISSLSGSILDTALYSL